MTNPTTVLTCPKCGGQMRSYERNGIVVDQCTECRGIFLDRGELERLIEGENAFYGRPAEPLPGGPPDPGYSRERDRRYDPDRRYDRDRRWDRDDRYDDDDDDDFGRRRGGFLGGLLDFD